MGPQGGIGGEKLVLLEIGEKLGKWLSQPTSDDLSPRSSASQEGLENPRPRRGGK